MTQEERLDRLTNCLQKLTIETKLQHSKIAGSNTRIDSLTDAVSTLNVSLQGNGKIGLLSKVAIMWRGSALVLGTSITGLVGFLLGKYFI